MSRPGGLEFNKPKMTSSPLLFSSFRSNFSTITATKRSMFSRFFNVLHYSTVALLVGSSVFLTVNVIGAAKAKKKSFREDREAAILANEKASVDQKK